MFKVGDFVKNNGTIYKIEYINGEKCELSFVIGDFDNRDTILSINLLKSATQVDIDSLQENFDYKIGEQVFFDGSVCKITNIDTTDDTCYRLNSNNWVDENDISKFFKVGDFVYYDNSIYKVLSINDDNCYLEIEFVIGDYDPSYNLTLTIDYDDCGMLEHTSEEDINSLQEGFEYQIGDKVSYLEKEYMIKGIDTGDNGDEYLLNNNQWVDESQFDDFFTKNDKFLVGDFVKYQNNIYEISDINNNISDIQFIIGNWTLFGENITISNDKLELANQSDIDNLQKDFKFKIGDEVWYENERNKVVKIDISFLEGKTYYLDNDDWVEEDDISKFAKLANFKVGDLVKYQNNIYKINVTNNIKSDIEFIIGRWVYEEVYLTIPNNELILANQSDVDILQKDFKFKIGDKVIYQGKEDTIKGIDIKNCDDRYFLECEDWTEEDNLTFSKDEEIKTPIVKEEVKKHIVKEEIKTPIVKEEVKKRRILLGAC